MKNKIVIITLAGCGIFLSGCSDKQKSSPSPAANTATPAPVTSSEPAALPENGFKAAITIVDPPAKLRAGQKQTIRVRVKNASDVLWYARGAAVNPSPSNKFYLAAGNRWLEATGDKLITDMDGRYGLDRDLKPGEETEVPLGIKAPTTPGDYTLEVDLVQEQVAWFHDKGSATARVKVKVER